MANFEAFQKQLIEIVFDFDNGERSDLSSLSSNII